MAKLSLWLFAIIFLVLCFELARGDHEYSGTFEDRLNILENGLESTKAKLLKTEQRLGETELKNKQLEVKLQISIVNFDSKYKELDDTIENTKIALKVTNDKLKATDAELRITQDELKIVTTTLYTTITNLKSDDNNLGSTESELHIVDSKDKHSQFKTAKYILKDSHIKRNGSRLNLGQLTRSEERSGQRLVTDKTEAYSKGEIIAIEDKLYDILVLL